MKQVVPVAALLLGGLLTSCHGQDVPQTTATLPSIQVFFSPKGGCTEAVVREIAAARSTILVQAYSFTSAPIAKALIDAHKRGVQVQAILDKSQRTEKYSSADFLVNTEVCTADAAEKPPDASANGPPIVSCKGWAVGDGKTGQLLWGFHESKPMKAASTTKIMCATVVLEQAKTNPKVLDEVLTFSKFAAGTGGSTAGIRAGESLKVSECLYGLLLPSGNDAGVALAQHFNRRLASPDPKPDKFVPNSRSNFIAEMNRTARRLGLSDTVYRSPFGDGAGVDEMTTSPRDLLKLAWTAMHNPLFCRYVCTERHECFVKQPDGSLRHVVWVNTNRLLKSKGYDGIKTGTTKPAGACLVSSGHLGDDHLIIVVLGSKSSDDRYRDTESLYRWAWKQRGHP